MNTNDRDEGTIETVPLHIWMHNVETAAVRAGADAEVSRDPETRARLIRWYHAGEPIWMAADGLRVMSEQAACASRTAKAYDAPGALARVRWIASR